MDKALGRNLIQRVNVGDALTRTANRIPDHLAVVDGGRRWTYRQFNTATNQFANGLLARDYQRGDVLALACGNSMEFLLTYFACAKTGVVCVPLNLGWGAKEIAYALGHSRARGIVVEAQLGAQVLPAVEQVPAIQEVVVAPGTGGTLAPSKLGCACIDFAAACSQDDAEPEVIVEDRDALSYLYTSGTTSAPKGVVTSHVAVYTEALMVATESEMRRDERIACLMPLFHTAQLNGFATPSIMLGTTQYLMRGFNATALLDLIEREHISRIFILPMLSLIHI